MTPQKHTVVKGGREVTLTIDESCDVFADGEQIGRLDYSRERRGPKRWQATSEDGKATTGGYTAQQAAVSLFYKVANRDDD